MVVKSDFWATTCLFKLRKRKVLCFHVHRPQDVCVEYSALLMPARCMQSYTSRTARCFLARAFSFSMYHCVKVTRRVARIVKSALCCLLTRWKLVSANFKCASRVSHQPSATFAHLHATSELKRTIPKFLFRRCPKNSLEISLFSRGHFYKWKITMISNFISSLFHFWISRLEISKLS